MSTISDTILNLQNATTQMQKTQKEEEGPSTELDSDAFLTLMIEQLKNQDPLDPMDNSQMISQQAALTQVSELQKMNETMSTNNMIMQATSLVGKEVTLIDPNDTTKTITGKVTSANFTSSTATVTVNGEEYPLGLVMSVAPENSGSTDNTGDTGSSGDTDSSGGSDSSDGTGADDSAENTTTQKS